MNWQREVYFRYIEKLFLDNGGKLAAHLTEDVFKQAILSASYRLVL